MGLPPKTSPRGAKAINFDDKATAEPKTKEGGHGHGKHGGGRVGT